jgi:citrate synthase
MEARRIPEAVVHVLPAIAASSPQGSLQALRTAVSLTASDIGCRPWTEQDADRTEDQLFCLAVSVGLLAPALYRASRGEEFIEPHPRLGFTANVLYMLDGVLPTRESVEGLELYLALAIEHGFNNSTFAARVVASSGADVGSAFAAAVGSLSGPLHGGAVGRVPSMLDEIGSIDRVESFIEGALDRGERLMGFGHPVYETIDPRSANLRDYVQRFGGSRVELARAFEDTAVRLINERKPGRRREANVDFYAGLALHLAGVPEEMYESTFAIARAIGWSVHIQEQISANRIFRPDAHYAGPSYPRKLPSA